jgi:hypothetical protein
MRINVQRSGIVQGVRWVGTHTIRNIMIPKRLLGETLEFRCVAEDIQCPVAATAVHGCGPLVSERGDVLAVVHDSVQHEDDIHPRGPGELKVVEEELLEDDINKLVFVLLALGSTQCTVFKGCFDQDIE